MPTGYVKEIAHEKHEPVAQVEHDWDRAKQIVDKEGQHGHWGLVMHVFKNIVKASGMEVNGYHYSKMPDTGHTDEISK